MFEPTFKDWPRSHRRLLFVTIILMVTAVAVLWFLIYPRWRVLVEIQSANDDMRTKLQKQGVRLDHDMLQRHNEECIKALNGTFNTPGLIAKADETIEKATSTFHKDILELYLGDETHGKSQEEIFITNTTRIDYIDLADRIKSEFKTKNIIFSEKYLERDTAEPIYQLILKLWTVRAVVRTALDNHLTVEEDQNGEASIKARRTIAYALNQHNANHYLLEFPISFRFNGTMDNFMAFAKSLNSNGTFLTLKHIRIFSQPPKEFPPEAHLSVSDLNFNVVYSTFFPAFFAPNETADQKGDNE